VRPALRILSVIVGIAALSYLAVCGHLWQAQRRLIFMPEALVDRTPADVGLEFVDIWIPAADGSTIAAWWLPQRSATGTKATAVLYLHGNDGNLARELHRLQALHGLGLPILAIDYRGYGRSGGPFPSEAQVYDDAVAAWSHLVRAKRIEPEKVIVYGHSLGAAVAVELALRRGPACGVVLESAFTSMADLARAEYPWIPVDLLLNQRFDVLRNIDRVQAPVLLVHGSADREVRPRMSERLYDAAHAPKRLLLVAGAGHEDAMPKGGEPMQRAVAELAGTCTLR
jgi:pimeloyl-ACP methyl ester carboxylesterase